jgi:hypothetical protein
VLKGKGRVSYSATTAREVCICVCVCVSKPNDNKRGFLCGRLVVVVALVYARFAHDSFTVCPNKKESVAAL